MDEETLFKTVYIAQVVAMAAEGHGLEPGECNLSAEATAAADTAWTQLQEFRGTVTQFVEIESTNPSGEPTSCGLCDSSRCTGHPQLRCERCGAEGLAENMTTERHTCRIDRIQQEPWNVLPVGRIGFGE